MIEAHNTGHRSLSKASQKRGSSGATMNKKHFKSQWERRASAGTTWRDDEIIVDDMKIRPVPTSFLFTRVQ